MMLCTTGICIARWTDGHIFSVSICKVPKELYQGALKFLSVKRHGGRMSGLVAENIYPIGHYLTPH